MISIRYPSRALPAVALLVGAALRAAEPLPIPAPVEHRSVGTLASIDLDARHFALASERGSEPFDWDDATEFVAAGAKIEPASLRAGDTLRVDWTARGEVEVATRVELVPPDPAPPVAFGARPARRSTPPL